MLNRHKKSNNNEKKDNYDQQYTNTQTTKHIYLPSTASERVKKSSHIRAAAHVLCIQFMYCHHNFCLQLFVCATLCSHWNHETKPFKELIKMKCISCARASIFCTYYVQTTHVCLPQNIFVPRTVLIYISSHTYTINGKTRKWYCLNAYTIFQFPKYQRKNRWENINVGHFSHSPLI